MGTCGRLFVFPPRQGGWRAARTRHCPLSWKDSGRRQRRWKTDAGGMNKAEDRAECSESGWRRDREKAGMNKERVQRRADTLYWISSKELDKWTLKIRRGGKEGD